MTQEENTNVVEQMIHFLSTPMAKRKGVVISAEDCQAWVDELKNYLQMLEMTESFEKELRSYEEY